MKKGNVEVVFPEKPSAEIREGLKRAGFRWSGMNGCWYGRRERLPASIQPCVSMS